jgi:hypothetical protein
VWSQAGKVARRWLLRVGLGVGPFVVQGAVVALDFSVGWG